MKAPGHLPQAPGRPPTAFTPAGAPPAGFAMPGAQHPGFPPGGFAPYPGPYAAPARKRPVGLMVALAAAVVLLSGVLVLALSQVIGQHPETTSAGYQNEDWSVPPVSSEPPQLPTPEDEAEAKKLTRQNRIYDVSLASPVRCDLQLPPGGEINDDKLQEHMEAYIGCLTRVWGPAIEAAGSTAYQPKITVYPAGEKVTTGCGSTDSGNAFFCPSDLQLYIAQDVLKALSDDASQARIVFDLIIAHEFGHAVQGRTGILGGERWLAESASSKQEKAELSRRSEVQADCFAGAALNSLSSSLQLTETDRSDIMRVMFEIGDDQLAERHNVNPDRVDAHGSGQNRRMWAERGLKAKSVEDCNTFTAPSSEVE